MASVWEGQLDEKIEHFRCSDYTETLLAYFSLGPGDL